MSEEHLGKIVVAKHKTVLNPPDASPIHLALCCADPEQQELKWEKVSQIRKVGNANLAVAEWAPPIMIVHKKGGILGSCLDYRRPYAVTVRDSYQKTHMSKWIDSLREAKPFLALSVSLEYWQIDTDEKDVKKAACVAQYWLYEYTRTSFHLENDPATFQIATDVILSTVKWHDTLICINYIIIFLKTSEEHLQHIEIVLNLLNNAWITITLMKCSSIDDNIDYFGHIVAPGKLNVAAENTKAIEALPYPTKVSKRQSL